jgi:hypothetical protein
MRLFQINYFLSRGYNEVGDADDRITEQEIVDAKQSNQLVLKLFKVFIQTNLELGPRLVKFQNDL